MTINKKILLIPVGLGILVAIIFSIIDGEKSGKNYTIEYLKSESSESTLKEVHFFLDNSGSMRGYCDFASTKNPAAKSTFKAECSNFLNTANTSLSSSLTIRCGQTKFLNTADFLNKLSSFNGGSSLIYDELAKLVLPVVSDSSIAVYATDLQLSYGSPKLISSKDPYYNVHHLEDLSALISTVASDAKKSGYDIAVVQYLSDFNGRYYYNSTENQIYPGNNRKVYADSLMKKRPFYFVIIGTKENILSVFSKECVRSANYSAVYSTFDIDSNDYVRDSYTVDVSGSSFYPGTEMDAKGTLIIADGNPDNSVVFSWSKFSIPSFVVPAIRDLTIGYDKKQVASVEWESDCSIKVTFKNSELSRSKYTYDGEITLTASNVMGQSNIDNDVTDASGYPLPLQSLEGRTFSLGAFIKGLNQAYFSSDSRPDIIAVKIPYSIHVE